jgi:ribonuclease D
MKTPQLAIDKIEFHRDDLPTWALRSARNTGLVSWDIETSGLDWRFDQIGTCQVYIPNRQVHIIRIGKGSHENLKCLLEDNTVRKVFHHAMFDLRFMAHYWQAGIKNVVCTKIASKIADPERNDHTLKGLVGDYFGVSFDKTQRRSNWLAERLSKEQLSYAAADVIYLPELFNALRRRLIRSKRWALASASFRYLPIRVMLDIFGMGDVFQYSSSHNNIG